MPPAGTPPEDAEEITITLARGAVLEGLIETVAGEPIAGARIRTRGAQAISDADGLYRVAGIPIATVELEVDHSHYGSQREEIEVEPGINHHDFIFEDGFAITGRVVDEAGEAVAGAALQISSTRAGDFRYFTASSAENGSFHLGSFADGRYRLEARKDGYAARDPVAVVTVAGAAVEDLELVMVRGAVIRGRILGLDFDQLARVHVEAETPGRPPHHGSVDYEGRYEVRDLAAGDWLLRASLDGGRRQTQARATLALGASGASRDLKFSRGFRLDGHVLEDGEPVAGATLALRGYQLAVERSVVSDHEGAFRIDDLEPGSYHLELIQARLYLVHNQDLELYGDRSLVIDLRQARVGGQVEVEGDGGPLAGALVVLRRLPELGGEENMITTGTGAEGRFYFPRVPAGRYRLTVRKDGYAADEIALDLAPGARLPDLEISVRPTAGVRLHVSLASGGSPAYVNVAVLDAAGGSWLRESRPVDAEGLVNLSTVPPGAWQLYLSVPGAAPARLDVEVPGEVLPVVLQPAARLRVKVLDLSDSDQIASLRLFAPSGRPFRDLDEFVTVREQWSMVAGKTVVDHLPVGSWTVVVQAADGRTWSGAVTVGAGTEAELRLE